MYQLYDGIVNSPETELTQNITATQTTIPVKDASKLPAPPNLAVIGRNEDAETILYTGKSGNTLTGVTRGFQGQARAWKAGAPVARRFTEYDWRALKDNFLKHARQPVFNVKGFGAKGDGVTDDTAAIQAAINAAAASPEGPVYFPRAVYKCASQISIPSGVTLVMEPGGKILSAYTPSDPKSPLIAIGDGVTQVTDVTLIGLHIDGNDNNHRGIVANYAQSVRIENCVVENVGMIGILLEGCNRCSVTGTTVRRVMISNGDYAQGSLLAQNSTEVTFLNNTIVDSHGKGIAFRLSSSSAAVGCRIVNTTLDEGDGIYVGYGCSDITVSACQVLDPQGSAVKLSRQATRVVVDGCLLKKNNRGQGHGALLQGTTDCTVSNCIISTDGDRDGVRIEAHPDQIEGGPSYRNTISGNVIRGTNVVTAAGVLTRIGAPSDTADVIISNNRINGFAIGVAAYTRQTLIRGNIIENISGDAVEVRYSGQNSIVEGNMIVSPGGRGIRLDFNAQSVGIAVCGNTLLGMKSQGVFAYNVADSIIANNYIAADSVSPGDVGVYLSTNTNSVVVFGNIITGFSTIGVWGGSSTCENAVVAANLIKSSIDGVNIKGANGRIIANAFHSVTTPVLVASDTEVFGNHSTVTARNANDLMFLTASKGPIVTTPDGTKKYRIRVDNNGTIVTERVS